MIKILKEEVIKDGMILHNSLPDNVKKEYMDKFSDLNNRNLPPEKYSIEVDKISLEIINLWEFDKVKGVFTYKENNEHTK